MTRRRKSLTNAWFDLAFNSMQLMQGSALVIGKRTAAMATAGPHPSAAHQREMRRMVEEKASASAESITRTAFASAAAWQSMAMTAMLGGGAPSSSQLQRATIKVLGTGAAPYRTKVRGNVKRLGRK
ncbi:MAG: hypothetical protein ABIU96_13825 [Rhodanobacter sp.]